MNRLFGRAVGRGYPMRLVLSLDNIRLSYASRLPYFLFLIYWFWIGNTSYWISKSSVYSHRHSYKFAEGGANIVGERSCPSRHIFTDLGTCDMHRRSTMLSIHAFVSKISG